MNPEELDDEWMRDEDEALPRGVTLDTIEITGRPDESGDDALDVAESIERKGAPGSGAVVSRMERIPAGARAAQAIGEGIDTVTSAAGLGTMAELPRRVRRMVPVVGDYLGDYAESGTAMSTGAVQGASLGFADEAAGGVAALGAGLSGEDMSDAYEGTRDRMRETADADREASPWAYGAGELVGAAATAPLLPSIGPGRAAPALERLGGALLEGSAYGGAAGLGFSEGDTGGEVLDDTLEGALGGAIAGGVGHGAVEGVRAGARAATAAAPGRRLAADRARVTSVIGTGNSPLSVRAERDIDALPGGMTEAADFIRREGIGSMAGTVEGAAERAAAASDRTGARVGAFNRELETALPEGIPAERFAGAFDEVAEGLTTNPETTEYAPRMADRARQWRDTYAGGERMTGTGPGARTPPGHVSVPGALDALDAMRGRIRDFGVREGRSAAGAELEGYRAGRRALDDVAEDVLPADRAAEFRPLRNDHARAMTLERLSGDAAARSRRSPGVGLRGAIGGSAAAAMGAGPVGSMVAAEGLSAWARRQPAMAATRAEAVASLLERAPEALGGYAAPMLAALSRGGEVFAGWHAALERADPEYAALVEEALPEPPPRSLADYLEEARAGAAPAAETPTTDSRSLAELLREAREAAARGD